MRSSGRTYFEQRDFYSNALFVGVTVLADGLTLKVPAPLHRSRTRGRLSRDIVLKRADLQQVDTFGRQVYRFGRHALLEFSDESETKPTIVSLWVANELMRGTAIVPRKATGRWCRQQVHGMPIS